MPLVAKANGTKEPFSEEKVIESIKRAGIPDSISPQVLEHVKSKLYENIPSFEIYHHIEEFLGTHKEYSSKSKYSLKRAIMELGPTGFPFEVYVSEILKAEGYTTEVGQIILGKCVNHEVDIVAHKGNEKLMVECKFHNRPGTRSDLHVSLYTKARFDDLKEKHGFTKAVLVTNTKVTIDALSYADCEGVKILSWSYPDLESIRDLIEKHKLFPITQLTYLTFSQKQELLDKDIVLISQICRNPDLINQTTIPIDRREQLLKEANEICRL